MILSFAHTMGEFGVVLMVGGNLPGVTRTVSISIFDQVQALDYARRRRNITVAAGHLFRGAGGHIRTAAAGLGRMADELTVDVRKRLRRRSEDRGRVASAARCAFRDGAVRPSGRRQNHACCGCIAGLDTPDAGSIRCGEESGTTARAAFGCPRNSAAQPTCRRTTPSSHTSPCAGTWLTGRAAGAC